jgi:hypothetical protein
LYCLGKPDSKRKKGNHYQIKLASLSRQYNDLLNAAKMDFSEEFLPFCNVTEKDLKEISNSEINAEGFSVWVGEGYAQRVRLYVVEALLFRSAEEFEIMRKELTRSREFYMQVFS